jgi:dienelactone hydrolase
MQNIFSKIFIPFFCIVSCANHQTGNSAENAVAKDSITTTATPSTADTFPPGKIVKNISCKNDASESYALYIPVVKSGYALPVVYFFDPHGAGYLPLEKYKLLADRYGFILVGSNNSKNGNEYATTENTWQHLLSDTKSRLHIDASRIYVCGFSGGAKAAGYLALNHAEIKSVIANSAALPDGTAAGNFNFSFTGLAGDVDMNMTNVVSFSNDLDKTSTHHRLIIFNGKHEWAPETAMNTAFEGLLFDAMRNKQIPADNAFIKNYISESKKRIDENIRSNNLIKVADECKLSMNMLDGLTPDISFFKQKYAAVTSTTAYQKQLKHAEDLFATEENTKANYQQQFQNGDSNYWKNTIAALNEKAKSKTDEGAMYNRLLAYLSLAFYSISNQFIQGNQNDGAAYFVSLYKLADPSNSEAGYFSAIVNARKNNSKAAEDDLLKAVENGFMDKNRMEQQPEFLSLHLNFSAIEAKMKNQ